MSGEEKANLITICLKKLAEVNVRAVLVTFDSPSAHFAAARKLGASLNLGAKGKYTHTRPAPILSSSRHGGEVGVDHSGLC